MNKWDLELFALQFWITVKRYRLYGESALDNLIGTITVAYTKTTISKINRPCWLEYCEPRVLSIPVTGTTILPKKTLVWKLFVEVQDIE
jgi:hypothetical protein